jgi:hypothetical protein
MARIINQSPSKRDPFDELSREVSALKDEVAALHRTITDGFQEVKSALGDILRALEDKDVS